MAYCICSSSEGSTCDLDCPRGPLGNFGNECSRSGSIDSETRGRGERTSCASHSQRVHAFEEIPIAAHIPNPLSEEGPASAGFTARDSRITAAHPLRHAVPNIVRCVADYHANAGSSSSMNGMNYLLTNLTVFLTHEPCIMCSMSLLHSRVKDVFYIFPMEKTGGCGGAACLPKLEGVNHRFNIYKWGGLDLLGQNVLDLRLNSELDA